MVKHHLTRSEYIDAANKFPKEIDARYELGDVIGRGGYAEVRTAISKIDRREVAVKTINRAGLKASTEAGIRREAELLRHLHHKNIVKSYDFLESPLHLHVVLERIDGGELFDRIIKKKTFNEQEARDIAVKILKAIKHCHDHKVVHRYVFCRGVLWSYSNGRLFVSIFQVLVRC
jgi:calcium/calmodulin-dependent protein kinase I